MSLTDPVPVYKTVHDPIQQHTAVRYNSRLRWTAMKLRRQQSVNLFYYSHVWRPFRREVKFVFCGCFLHAFSWVRWRRLRKRIIWYLSSWGRLILSYWQNDKKNTTNVKLKWLIKQSITQAIYPILFICPFICNLKYQGINRSKSHSRYCN